MIWAFIYSNLIGNSIGLNICGMWVSTSLTALLTWLLLNPEIQNYEQAP